MDSSYVLTKEDVELLLAALDQYRKVWTAEELKHYAALYSYLQAQMVSEVK